MSATKRRIHAVHQILPSFAQHDAIGNEVRLLNELIREAGFASSVFADSWQRGLDCQSSASLLREGRSSASTAVLYHFSIASQIPFRFAPSPCVKLVRYHSITPFEFFNQQEEDVARRECATGRSQLPLVGLIADGIAAASAHNADELNPFSRRPATVVPVLRDYLSLTKSGSDSLLRQLNDAKRPTLLFVGRFVPHKCQQDIVLLVHLAKKHLGIPVRALLVGGVFSAGYQGRLEKFSAALGLTLGRDPGIDVNADIVIPPKIDDATMATYYRHAHAFVSMSEHEGFGVPLVEAMHFGLPILAHAAAAVPETVGDAGVVLDKNDWPNTLAALKALLTDEGLRSRLKGAMTRRATQLGFEATKAAFAAWLAEVTSDAAT